MQTSTHKTLNGDIGHDDEVDHNDDGVDHVDAVAHDGADVDHDDNQEPCKEGSDICTHLITLGALLLTVATLPVSLILVIKVVQVADQDHPST